MGRLLVCRGLPEPPGASWGLLGASWEKPQIQGNPIRMDYREGLGGRPQEGLGGPGRPQEGLGGQGNPIRMDYHEGLGGMPQEGSEALLGPASQAFVGGFLGAPQAL